MLWQIFDTRETGILVTVLRILVIIAGSAIVNLMLHYPRSLQFLPLIFIVILLDYLFGRQTTPQTPHVIQHRQHHYRILPNHKHV